MTQNDGKMTEKNGKMRKERIISLFQNLSFGEKLEILKLIQYDVEEEYAYESKLLDEISDWLKR